MYLFYSHRGSRRQLQVPMVVVGRGGSKKTSSACTRDRIFCFIFIMLKHFFSLQIHSYPPPPNHHHTHTGPSIRPLDGCIRRYNIYTYGPASSMAVASSARVLSTPTDKLNWSDPPPPMTTSGPGATFGRTPPQP